MSKKLLSLLAVGMLVLVAALPGRAAEKKGHPYVVLVGVSQYKDKQIKPRPHAEADVKALYDLFMNKEYLGVQADHMHLLLGAVDPQRQSAPATRDNVIKAIHDVASSAGPNDPVILAYIGEGAPLNEAGDRMCYFAADSTIKDRSKNAVAAADIQQELDKLKSQRFCAFVDVNFHGFKEGPEKLPEPIMGTNPYRELLGADAKEVHEDARGEQPAAPGRALFLATSGVRASLDLEKQGIFTQVLLDGLKGAADKDGFEPDGVVTVDELGAYIEKHVTELALKYGKTDEEKRQTGRFYESRLTHFALTHNPAVAAKVAERLEKFKKLVEEQNLDKDWASEGRTLLERMPKLKAQQELRRQYQKLVDGKVSLADFTKERRRIVKGMELDKKDALAYAAKVIQSTQIIQREYVKELTQADLVGWAIRGLYRQLEVKVPSEIQVTLDSIKGLGEPELTSLLADARQKLGRREDLANHKDIDISLQRMLAHLDPYTTYYDPETLLRFRQETDAQFSGIGVSIRENRTKGALEVITPLKGSPAYRNGILAGDLITTVIREVDDSGKQLLEPEIISTKGMSTSEAVKKIQGKAGTKIKIVVEREGADKPLTFEIKRGVIEVETVMGFHRNDKDDWDYMIDPVNKIAYVRLTTFARKSYRDMLGIVSRLNRQGIKGFVLDLRFNPGGLLTSAIEISDMFVDDGVIVTIRPRVGREIEHRGEHEGSFLNFPMVCLVNGMSASGSEIVAACLQDHERALIMGERTYGKGSVQNIQPFEGGELKFTTASYWRPSGKNINKSSTTGKDDDEWGVTPNAGFTLNLSDKDRDQLYEYQRDSEIIPRRDIKSKEKKTDFKDKQLEMALDYLRSQIKTAKSVTKRAG
ncbi:MAG TPA: S41 family peptidase [Gemmataceae bacterium]|nr:S41 family peptidase [Gemmataceae bacterium]